MALGGLAAALAAAPALADDGVQLGATYRGLIQFKTYGSPQLPLPPGDWKLVGLEEARSDNTNIRVLNGVLAQVRTGTFSGAVIFTLPDSPSRGGWGRPSFCDRKNILANFSVSESSSGLYDCLAIEPINFVRGSTAGKSIAQLFDYLETNKFKKPITALSVNYGVSGAGAFLAANYLFNPDMEKVPPAGIAAWHIDRYKEDPKRAAYVDTLKAWAQELRPKIADALKGRLSGPDQRQGHDRTYLLSRAGWRRAARLEVEHLRAQGALGQLDDQCRFAPGLQERFAENSDTQLIPRDYAKRAAQVGGPFSFCSAVFSARRRSRGSRRNGASRRRRRWSP